MLRLTLILSLAAPALFALDNLVYLVWAVSLGDIGVFGFWSMVVFLAVLTVGFIYEWKKGALEWE